MSGLVQFKMTGLKELQAQLVDLGAQLGVKALAQAARKAFKPVLDAARAKVPVASGALALAIKLAVVKPGSGDGVVMVGLRIGSGKGGPQTKLPPGRRWHWIELGTAHMAAHPFLRPALDQNAAAVLELLKVEIRNSIQKALRKKGAG